VAKKSFIFEERTILNPHPLHSIFNRSNNIMSTLEEQEAKQTLKLCVDC